MWALYLSESIKLRRMKESTTRPPPQSILCTTPKRVNSTNSSSTAQSSGRTIQTSYQTQVYNFTPQNIVSILKITLKNKLFLKSFCLNWSLYYLYITVLLFWNVYCLPRQLGTILLNGLVWRGRFGWLDVWLGGLYLSCEVFNFIVAVYTNSWANLNQDEMKCN